MRPGQELAGRYRLEQRLGRGAMGEVWRALDLRLDRRVAVKVLLANLAAGEQMDQALARFRREGKAAARLNHPYIAAVHDIAVHDGQPFLVLELLAGPDLAALLNDHPGGLPIGMVLEHGAQVAEGLAAAHAARVIHRDIKPSNLMLDGNGTLKICDFGIARLGGATAGLSAGARIGTLAYMPPEQLLGEPVTGAADVYALGATLFHLLTGRLLFPADDLRAVIGQHLNKTPPPPSSLRPAIPNALDTYLLTLLAKDPSSRPPAHTIPARLRALTTHLGAEVLLADAERLAHAITSPFDQAGALAEIAKVVDARDPARADALLADAERLAIPGPAGRFTKRHEFIMVLQIRELTRVASVMAARNPAKADALLADIERLARGIPDPTGQAGALAEIAKVVAARDPAKAEELFAGAERLARTVPSPHGPDGALRRIAGAMAEQNPAGAEHLARAIGDGYCQAEALEEIAEVVAARDPAKAEELLADADAERHAEYQRCEAVDWSGADSLLRRMAKAMVKQNNPAGAESVARQIRDSYRRAETLQWIAGAMAEQNPADAERLARTITHPTYQVKALAEIARVLTEQRAPLL